MTTNSSIIILTSFLLTTAHAEIITDGTLGNRISLHGPNFQIDSKLGQQIGGNLFHSFQDFNLQSHESATFSGPDNVQNVISRVTGGNPSTIDGALRSTIPNADVYFLNPYGIMFGPNAKLDVQGGFHASTADYLRLQDEGKFEARIPGNSLLTMAPVVAFGFLTDSPAALSLQESQLSVPYGQTFSLTGGDFSLNLAQVNAPGGQVTLSSLAQAGQFSLANHTLSGKGGTIELQNQSTVNVSGIGGGNVLIRGGQLVMDNSVIESHTLGDQDGQGIDIVTTETITVKGDVSAIHSQTFGSGKGGDIQMTTARLEVTGSRIDTTTFNNGAAGNLAIQANQVILRAGSVIGNDTYGEGVGGLVQVIARDSVTVAGHREGSFNNTDITLIIANGFGIGRAGEIQVITPHLVVDEGTISMETIGPGGARDITIKATTVTLKNGGIVASDTFSNGSGGDINLEVTDELKIIGRRSWDMIITSPPLNWIIEEQQSGITSSTFGSGSAGRIIVSASRLVIEEGAITAMTVGQNQGLAGKIHITVNDLRLNNGGSISSSSGFLIGNTLFPGTGEGGKVQIEVAGDLHIQGRNSLGFPSNISSNTLTIGHGGSLTIRANHLQLSDGGAIMANSLGFGNAGELLIQADTLEILNESEVTTSAQRATGGSIHLAVANRLYLHQGQITTSVMGGIGNGGNIILERPQFVVLNQGQIKAQADEGHGGNIRIVAEQFIPSADSFISASSQKGISGNVVIHSPENNIGNNLVILETQSLKADQGKTLCSKQRTGDRPSRFIVTPLAGYPLSPNDWRGSTVQK